MSAKAIIVIRDKTDAALAARWCQIADKGTVIEFKGAKRTLPQNARMWAMLTDIVRQSEQFRGWDVDLAKVAFMRACGEEVKLIRSPINGEIFAYGRSSSKLTVKQMTDLIEFMFAWGAEQETPIAWSDPTEEGTA